MLLPGVLPPPAVLSPLVALLKHLVTFTISVGADSSLAMATAPVWAASAPGGELVTLLPPPLLLLPEELAAGAEMMGRAGVAQ